jgi:hypothetical protein
VKVFRVSPVVGLIEAIGMKQFSRKGAKGAKRATKGTKSPQMNSGGSSRLCVTFAPLREKGETCVDVWKTAT